MLSLGKLQVTMVCTNTELINFTTIKSFEYLLRNIAICRFGKCNWWQSNMGRC